MATPVANQFGEGVETGLAGNVVRMDASQCTDLV